jgi:hypothetical protein
VWLWLAGLVLWFGLLPLLGYNGRLYYAEGGQSIDGPGMLLAAAGATSVMFLPVFLAILACYLLRYRGPGPLSSFRTRSYFGNLLTALAIFASLFCLWAIFWRVDFWKLSRFPFVAYFLAWSIYFQYLRAAAVNRAEFRAWQTDGADIFE